jgi:uncharacterized membrane protein
VRRNEGTGYYGRTSGYEESVATFNAALETLTCAATVSFARACDEKWANAQCHMHVFLGLLVVSNLPELELRHCWTRGYLEQGLHLAT